MEERVKANTERINSIESRVTALETRLAVAENNIENINRKLDKIDSNTTWLLRIVIGAIVVSVMGLLMVQGPKVKAFSLLLMGGN